MSTIFKLYTTKFFCASNLIGMTVLINSRIRKMSNNRLIKYQILDVILLYLEIDFLLLETEGSFIIRWFYGKGY